MFIRASEDEFVPLREPLSFADWIIGGHELGWPTEEDLAYHLTTLFPPIRPRGWLELRMVDSLPSRVVDRAGDRRGRAARGRGRVRSDRAAMLEPLAGRWEDAGTRLAARSRLRRAAHECFAAALDALPRLGADAERHRRRRALPRPVRAARAMSRPTISSTAWTRDRSPRSRPRDQRFPHPT